MVFDIAQLQLLIDESRIDHKKRRPARTFVRSVGQRGRKLRTAKAATSRSTSVEAPPLACTFIPLSVAAMKRAAARQSTAREMSPLALPSSIASVRVA